MTVGIAPAFGALLGESVRVEAYDGSASGLRHAETTVQLRSPAAVAYVLTAPGHLGLARAYVSGALDVQGDLYAGLLELVARPRAAWVRDLARVLRGAGASALRRPPVPREEAPARWRRGLARHTRHRDAAAIAHHYDVSNRFYEIILGRSMAYSCGVFETKRTPLDAAQERKFDLICRKLDLRPGQRLLDVGAGWGGLVRHAALHYGVSALGVTLSRQQVEWARRENARAGLERAIEIRLLDYRDLPPSRTFDAIASVGAMEHFGTAELGRYFAAMAAHLRPGGRLLNHCITRPSNHERERPAAFMDRYVFPDGELQGPATVIAALHDNDLELRHSESLREHYALTLREWVANLETRWAAAVAEVGERRARVWRLYMTASRVAFELGRLQIHQMLGVRSDARGGAGMPLRPTWEQASAHAPRPASVVARAMMATRKVAATRGVSDRSESSAMGWPAADRERPTRGEWR